MIQMSKNTITRNKLVQIKNPRVERYSIIDKVRGEIINHKRSEGPYKNIPIIRKPIN